ncbi:hypothetical protein BK140_32440 [Paenibacillus macerans]|nr:hypothetical protein BK140_32440 [Paenibacillus macerans]
MNGLEKYFTPLAIQKMEENQISIKMLASRLLSESDLDKVFEFKTRGRKSVYPAWAYKKAKENGISRQLLYERVKKQGLSIEDAVKRKVAR